MSAPSAQKLAENVERIETLSRRLMAALSERQPHNPGVEGPGPDLYVTAANAWMRTLTEQPTRIIEQQVNFWGETLKNYANAQFSLAKGHPVAPEEGPPADKRFRNPLWQSHPYFSFVRKQYLINADAMKRAADGLELPDETARRRVNWLTEQIVDMMSPTNFLATNPDALEKAIETEGESLVRGLENLVRDVEQHGGEMIVSLADREAFMVGENIGTAAGRVVHRTPLYELIQYNPTTDRVHETPLLIFPPWINKFYILDLKPQNSLIRWLVGQGHTLFVVSWKNPDASYAEFGMEEYVAAYLEAMDKVRDLTDQRRLNVVGYCIAGTTLSLTLALLSRRGDDRVNSATLFTTLTDFSNHGEFTAFLQNDFVDGIEEEIRRHGLLKAPLMSRTMSFLRANDLVWGPAIRSYMMGETPPAFDLLFWNGDSTNLPGKMAMQYLRGLCQANDFAGEGFELFGQKLRLADVQVPLCSVACEGDHIAPWTDCWRGVAQMGSGEKTFILSESGHVAGIVNPPGRDKYGHYTGESGFADGAEGWRESATLHKGSWWPSWGEWLAARAGRMIDARHPDEECDPAPGSYVHERAL
ncbi:class I poly(R)-hydroxyalkanoic acid synthase [Paracoccus alkanivorans]|nr:class I poly(R)-hydroxyalkanoic acid synthase [Paracoccus alkanivorans]